MKKKILILGGADIQISAIVKAKELGYYVVTCDYLPENPGHKYSDEYYNVSTTDKEAVLNLAKNLEIDGISAYASDPAALTAAYVAEKLNLPGNSHENVLQLSDKLQFRAVQKKVCITFPDFCMVNSPQEINRLALRYKDGIIIKPVDTSGSKGVFRITPQIESTMNLNYIEKALETGIQFSRMKKIIAEEYIVRKGFLMSGDLLIENGKILFMCFGDVHFNSRINGLVPRSISLPSSKSSLFFDKVKVDLQKIVTELNIVTGVFNADVIESENGDPVIIDIGARNGGNMFNDIIYYHSGVNLIELSLKQCCGEPINVEYNGTINGFYAHNVIHSESEGILQSIEFSNEIEPLIIYKNINKSKGERVEKFTNSSHRIGLILLKFKTFEQAHDFLGQIYRHIKVKLK